MRKALIRLGCTFLLAGCGLGPGQDLSEPAIVGGVQVSTTDVITKSTVALVAPDGQAFCTGSLLTKRLIVTAAHCLDGYTETAMYVAFGTVARNGSFVRERLRVVRAYAKHEAYDTEAMEMETAARPPHDIGLVTLTEDAPLDNAPVATLRSSNDLFVNETLTLAGFGLTHWRFGTSGVLRKVDVKLTSVASLAKEIHFGGIRGKSACMGDSGGPAFVKRNSRLVLVGVTSRGSGDCSGEGVYTDIRQYVDWINARAAGL